MAGLDFHTYIMLPAADLHEYVLMPHEKVVSKPHRHQWLPMKVSNLPVRCKEDVS